MKKLLIVFIILAFAIPAFPALDFAGFINSNVSWTAEKKTAMLNDFCNRHKYDSAKQSGETKQEFFNRMIAEFIKNGVDQQRKWDAEAVVTFEPLDDIE